MKLNILILILLLILSIKTGRILDPYSIETFKEKVKKNGLFKIIESIKNIYGQDVAIISCEELNQKNKGNCKKLVTEYMEHDHGLFIPKQKIKCTKGLYLSPYIKQSNPNLAIKEILRSKFNEIQTILIYNTIIKRVCKK